jgi:cephalosporin hydroxylase
MNFNEICHLADTSKGHVDMGAYANKRARWTYDPSNAGKDMWWGKEQPYYKFIYLLTKTYPGIYLEIGTHRGIAFACAAAGGAASPDPNSRFAIGIDIVNNQDIDGGNGPAEVERIFPRAKFINMPSTDPRTLSEVNDICTKTGLKISIIFIDAVHKMSIVNSELKLYKPYYADKALWMFDDIIEAANNTHLPLMFDKLPGQKARFTNLHTDNCVAVALVDKLQYSAWDPGTYTKEDLERGYRSDEAYGPEHNQRW